MGLQKGVDFTWGWWSRPRHEGMSFELVWVPRVSTAYDALSLSLSHSAALALAPCATHSLFQPLYLSHPLAREFPVALCLFSPRFRRTCIILNIIVKVLPCGRITTVRPIYVIVGSRVTRATSPPCATLLIRFVEVRGRPLGTVDRNVWPRFSIVL